MRLPHPLNDPLTPIPPGVAINTRRVVRCPARIVRMRLLTHDTYELVVRTADGSPPLCARAGQFAAISVPGVARPRSYSFARDPRREHPGDHTFFIRLVPGGEMSCWLAAKDRSGESVEIAGPLGGFVLDDGDSPMLFVAGGSGLSAVKALAEEASRRRLTRDCLFLYGARSQRDLYAQHDVAQLAAAWAAGKRMEFVAVLSDEPAESSWRGPRGFVTDYLRVNYLDRDPWRSGRFKAWLCGPPPMVEAANAALRNTGAAPSDIYCDAFADARSAAPVIDNRRCALCDECLLVKPVADCIVETDLRSGAGVAKRDSCSTPIRPTHTAGLYYNALVINDAQCIRCYACVQACPHGAIRTSS